VREVADLALLTGLDLESGDRREEYVRVRVSDDAVHARALRGLLVPHSDELARRLRCERHRKVAQPRDRAFVTERLLHPRDVLVPVGPQHHVLADDPGHVEPAVAGGTFVGAQQRADPAVDQLPAMREPAAHRAVEGEAEPPRELAGGPVPLIRPPDHRLEIARLEPPVEQQTQGAFHEATTARLRMRTVGDLGACVVAVAQRHRSGVPPVGLDGERPLEVASPAAGDGVSEKSQGVVALVGDRHRRPPLAERVAALFHAALGVVEAMGPQRHRPVAEGGDVLGVAHRTSLADAVAWRKSPIVVAMDESHRP